MTSGGAPPNLWDKITRGTAEIISEAELRAKLDKGKPLRIKLGVDPTAPDLHLGHLALLRKLRTFQDLGHQVVFIVGDFTARIGDPSGRSQLRPQIGDEEIEKNARTYLDQVFQVLDRKRTEVRYNSEWLLKLKSPFELASVLNTLFQRATVQRLMERDDFTKRQKAGQPVFLSELSYPLFQGYDSVVVKADVEIGGVDQLYNLLMGRDIQRDFGQEPQVVMTLPLLEGLDGARKMSKSFGNYVAFNDPPREMFGKLMSIPDALMPKYAELLTDIDASNIKSAHPRDAKVLLATAITAQFHGEGAADQVAEEFDRVFSKKEIPSEIEERTVPFKSGQSWPILDLIMSMYPFSKKEARRLIEQGAVEIDGKRCDLKAKIPLVPAETHTIKIGKHRFVRVRSVPASI